MSRARVVAEARRWLGTPYRHQASLRGEGCDCLGLIRGIWRTCLGPEPERLPPYAPDWCFDGDDRRLHAALERYLLPVPVQRARPGDVVLFRPRERRAACHCAVLARQDAIIHAYWNRSVVETPFSRWWRRRQVAVFAFPERLV